VKPASLIVVSMSNRKSGFLFQSANGTMFDPRNIARDSLEDILQEMGVAKRGRSSMFSGASEKSCCNEAMHGKS
jgi:hypothetical protein